MFLIKLDFSIIVNKNLFPDFDNFKSSPCNFVLVENDLLLPYRWFLPNYLTEKRVEVKIEIRYHVRFVRVPEMLIDDLCSWLMTKMAAQL